MLLRRRGTNRKEVKGEEEEEGRRGESPPN